MEYRRNQKKQSKKALLEKRRDSAFIAEYVKRKAPETYAEAKNFLETLRQQYPDRKDYTKTHEFLTKTTDYEDYKDYYNRKRRRAKQNKTTSTSTTSTSTTSTSTTVVDNMVLDIPLLQPSDVAQSTLPLEPINPEIYEQILKEITMDPALNAIFNDVCTNQDPEDDMEFNTIVLDESITGLSPLEKELLNCN